jgi:hypothetical protein
MSLLLKLKFLLKSKNTPASTFPPLTAVIQSALMEVVSTFFPAHQTVLFALEMLTLLMMQLLEFVPAKLVSIMLLKLMPTALEP